MEESRLARQAYEYYSGQIRLAYHHFANTSYSEIIAVALEAAGEQGKFWEMHDRFIGDDDLDVAKLLGAAEKGRMNLDEFAVSHVTSEAQNLTLDMGKFFEALENEQYLGKVRLAKQEAIQMGVTRVSLFINGVEYTKHPCTFDDFCLVINEELARLGINTND